MVARTFQAVVSLALLVSLSGCQVLSLSYEPPVAPGDRPKIDMTEVVIGTGKIKTTITADGTVTHKTDETGDVGNTTGNWIESIFGGATD